MISSLQQHLNFTDEKIEAQRLATKWWDREFH